MLNELRNIYTPKLLSELGSRQIIELQESLRSLGYEVDVSPNGILSNQTATAFAEWKLFNRLKGTDTIGPNSLAVLERDLERLQESIEV